MEDELDESKKQHDFDVERIANLEQLKNELQTEVVRYTSIDSSFLSPYLLQPLIAML